MVTSLDRTGTFKATFPGRVPSGSLQDTDIYGDQQHALFLTLRAEGMSNVG